VLFLQPSLQSFALRYADEILATAKAVCQTSQVRIMRTQNVLVLARDWQATDLYFAIARVGDRAGGEAIRRTWCERTGAQSVLRLNHAARVSF
jgi:hypothetical protein